MFIGSSWLFFLFFYVFNTIKDENINNRYAIENGNIFVHPNPINWSYLTLGKLVLAHININTNSGVNFVVPKNNIDVSTDILSKNVYSAKYKYAKAIPPYSVNIPPTNSDSASGKSKGGLFVSAIADIINNINIGNNGIINGT